MLDLLFTPSLSSPDCLGHNITTESLLCSHPALEPLSVALELLSLRQRLPRIQKQLSLI